MKTFAFARCLVPRLHRAAIGLAFAALAAGAAGAAHSQEVQGITDNEILLGSHQDLSGPAASLGVPIRDGIRFAVDEINAAGGIHGRKLRLLVEDNAYDPKKAVLATQKLVTQDKVFAMIGTFGTPTSLASMPVAIERGVPFLFPTSPTEAVFQPLSPLKFGLLSLYSDQTRAAVKFAYEKRGKRRFGILYQDDDNGQSYKKAVETQLKVHGLTLTETASYKRGETDFSSQMARLKAADADVVMLGISGPRETVAATSEARKLGWNVDFVAGPGASVNATIKLGGQAVEGLYVTFQFLGAAQAMTPVLRAAQDRYKARYGVEPSDGIPFGYIAVMLFAEGAKNAGRNLTPQTLSQGLEKVRNFTTVFEAPPVSYGPGDHAPPRTTIIMQVQGGKYVAVTGAVTY